MPQRLLDSVHATPDPQLPTNSNCQVSPSLAGSQFKRNLQTHPTAALTMLTPNVCLDLEADHRSGCDDVGEAKSIPRPALKDGPAVLLVL